VVVKNAVWRFLSPKQSSKVLPIVLLLQIIQITSGRSDWLDDKRDQNSVRILILILTLILMLIFLPSVSIINININTNINIHINTKSS